MFVVEESLNTICLIFLEISLSILYLFNLTSYLMEIRSLGTVDFDSLFKSFERAFEDYAINFEKEEVRSMLIRRGYDPKLSFGAFVDDEMVLVQRVTLVADGRICTHVLPVLGAGFFDRFHLFTCVPAVKLVK